MKKKVIAILLGLVIIISQSIALCLEENVASAENESMLLGIETDSSIVFDFTDDLKGITGTENVVTAELDNGSLKCVSVPGSNTPEGINIPLANIDGEYYNSLKFKAKVESASSTTGSFKAVVYYTGVNKTVGTSYIPRNSRSQSIEYINLTNIEGIYENTDFEEYVLDLSTISNWSNSNISELRIDILKDATGIVYIDDLTLYNKTVESAEPTIEPSAEPTLEPSAEPTLEPSPIAPDAVEGEEVLMYDFNEGSDGFLTELDVTLKPENGILTYISKARNQDGKILIGNMFSYVSFEIGQYYKMEMRVKLDGVTPTVNSNERPKYTLNYDGTGEDGTRYTISSSRQTGGVYSSELNENDGLYYSDWQTVTVDFGTLPSWNLSKVNILRMDLLKDAEGTILIDYIKLISVPGITEFTFDGKADIDNAVPTDTKTIVAKLSQSLSSVNEASVSIRDIDGMEVKITSVKNNAEKGIVTVTVEGLEPFTEYSFVINKNATATTNQKLYKEITKKFTTAAGEFEYYAVGNMNSAKLNFMNNGAKPKELLLVATFWDDDRYMGKKLEKYTAELGATEYNFDYSDKKSGNKAEVIVWEYGNGIVQKVHGRKVYVFE